uniref:Uncharacterized protein n=1 Tax=Anguilla anguilla TaxID=7936 RepID=A0A0E9QBN1_ANGAN
MKQRSLIEFQNTVEDVLFCLQKSDIPPFTC